MTFTLRDYQTAAIESLRAQIRAGVRRLLLVSGTGTGKTVIAAAIIGGARQREKRILFLAHRRELIEQTSRKLDAIGVDHGICQASHWRTRPWLPVQVASIQTLINRELPFAPDLIIIDETHRARAGSYQDILARYPNAVSLGLTATPVRSDGKGLGTMFDVMVQCPSVRAMIDRGFLVPIRAWTQPEQSFKGVRKTGGDYNLEDLAVRMDQAKLVGNIVRHWRKLANNRQTVVFAVNVEHSKHICKEFTMAGVLAEHLDGTTPTAERDAILDRLATGRTRVVTNCQVLSEGWDCLDSQTEILTRDGWRGVGQIDQTVPVFSLNRTSGAMELTPVISYGERLTRLNERMVSIKSQHADIRTTEGHQFHVTHHAKWLTLTGFELAERRATYTLPLSADMGYRGVPLSDDELRFVAWFMTDGWREGNGAKICIAQSKHHKDDIRSLLNRLGFDFKERVRPPRKSGYANPSGLLHVFTIPKGVGKASLARNGWVKLSDYLDKNVASALHDMSREQFRVFWAELLKGDGEASGGKSGWLWCDRKEQADAYTQMAVTRGFAASYSTRLTKHNHLMYRVSVRDKQWLASTPTDSRAAKIRLDVPTDRETVWCIRNENSTLVTRRNGKIAIIGNCPPVSCIVLARPTLSAGLYLQMAGRALRPSDGKQDCILLDHAGCVRAHGLVDEDREWTLTADKIFTKKSISTADTIQVCPKCMAVAALSVLVCPECGYEFARRKPREVKEEDGDLVEATPEVVSEGQMRQRRRQYEFFLHQQEYGRRKDGSPFARGYAEARYRGQYKQWPPANWRTEWKARERQEVAS